MEDAVDASCCIAAMMMGIIPDVALAARVVIVTRNVGRATIII